MLLPVFEVIVNIIIMRIVASIALTCIASTCLAINNIESQRFKPIPQGWSGEVQGAFSGRAGNSDKQSTLLNLRADYQQDIHQVLLIGKREYGQNDSKTDIDNSFVHLRYIHHMDKNYAWETYTQYDENFFRQLEARALAGGGMRFNLLPQKSATVLIVGAGAYYTEEKYDYGPYSVTENYARLSTYVTYRHLLSDTVSIANTLYLQPRFSQPSDLYAYNLLTLAVKLSATLQLQLNVESQYDSDPILDLKRYDHNYYTAIVYQF